MRYGKRYTNPERWSTPRFRKLSAMTKLLYLYLLDNCDWAGFLEIDSERIAFDTGISIDEVDHSLKDLNGEEIVINDGWLLCFLFFYLKVELVVLDHLMKN